jgi:hypothetical protein
MATQLRQLRRPDLRVTRIFAVVVQAGAPTLARIFSGLARNPGASFRTKGYWRPTANSLRAKLDCPLNRQTFDYLDSVAIVKPTISHDGGRQRQELKPHAGTADRQVGPEHFGRRIW